MKEISENELEGQQMPGDGRFIIEAAGKHPAQMAAAGYAWRKMMKQTPHLPAPEPVRFESRGAPHSEGGRQMRSGIRMERYAELQSRNDRRCA